MRRPRSIRNTVLDMWSHDRFSTMAVRDNSSLSKTVNHFEVSHLGP